VSYGEVLPVLISAIAAGVPLVTFVYTLALRARVEVQIGEEVALHYTADRLRLILRADFVFLNAGAQPAAMTGLYATLWPRGERKPGQPNLRWEQYEGTQRDPKSPLGSPARYQSGSTGVVETTVISGHSVIANRIRLYSMTRCAITETDYLLSLRAVDGSVRRRGGSLNCRLRLRPEDLTLLRENGAEKDGLIQARVVLRRAAGPEPADGRSARQGPGRIFRPGVVRFER
jgi:hypothetical protein